MADKPFHDDTKKTKTKRWTKYKESCQDIKRLLNKSGLRSTTQPLIINGNLCKPVKINKNKVIIYNTCPFDALLACVVVGYIEFNQYRECVNEVAKSNSFINVCKEVANYRATDSIYEERGKILWEIFQQKNVIVDNIQSLHTECNVTYLFEKLLKIMPSVFEKHVCDSCNVTKSFNNVLVILEMEDRNNIKTHGFKKLQDAMKNYSNTKFDTCRTCKERKIIYKDFNDHLRIETDWFQSFQSKFYTGVPVSDIPTKLLLADKRYYIYLFIIKYK